MNTPGVVHLDTAEVSASEREELVRTVVAQAVVPLELEHRQGGGQAITMRLDAVDLGPVSVQSMRMSAVTARRTDILARDDSPPSLFVIVKRRGSSAVVHHGRDTVIGPGDLVLVRTTEPSLVMSDGWTHQHSLQIPLRDLGLTEPVLRHALALRLGSERPLVGVLGHFMDSLTTIVNVQPAEACHLARVAIDLVSGLIITVPQQPRQPRHPRAARPGLAALDPTLTTRLVDYLHAHWPQHDLAPSHLATAHQVSLEQLNQLLTDQGVALDGGS